MAVSLNTVQKAVKAQLETLAVSIPGLRLVFENQDDIGHKTFLDVQVVFTGAMSDTFGGQDTQDSGFVSLVAAVPDDTSTEEAYLIFDAVRTLFPVGKRITVAGGYILIQTPVQITSRGYATDSDWRLPFQIRFEVLS